MNQKVSGTAQQPQKGKDSKSQKTLKATVSPKLSSKQLGQKKTGKREKSEKKNGQTKSKKEFQLIANYFDKDEYNDAECGNYEYYTQAHNRANKKSSRKDKDIISYSRSKQTSFETESLLKTSAQIKKMQSTASYNRLKLPESKGVITFDGKYVKAQPQQVDKHYNYNITNSNSQYTDLFYCEKDNEGKKKKRKRQKSRNKTNEKKMKSKSKSKNHHDIKKKLIQLKESQDFQQNSLSKKYKNKEKDQCQETEPSPSQSVIYRRGQTIDYEEVQFEVTKDKQKSAKVNIPKNCLGQRMKCINMLSKICGEMQFKKQTYALSVKILDRYLHEQIVGTKMKVIALATLILSLKLEEAEMAATFQFQIATANTCNNTRQLRSSIPTGDRKVEARSTSKKKSKKDEITNKVGDKKTDSIYNKVNTLSYILADEFGNDLLSKSELLEFESLIVLKLNYMMRFKTSAYWVDLFTVIWDQRILASYPEYNKLLFRCPKYRINISYLLQILEILHYDLQVYNYHQITLVLSAMYLLIRITMEEDPDGYENYRKILQKSSNALFVDNVGCNKLFGEYLQSISMEMGEILQCCQFVSKYLLPGILKKHRFHGSFDFEENFDYVMSTHCYNPQLYRYLNK